ncbi:conserved hypothetical protein [Ricinus communis]|uniref:Uncharacterized protein n=1 Tax=Ricinus communis TaxID=3988 RepID=B9S6K4_RICCO|nr:conserved hypothetical protein [Ricinus communis]
MAVEVNSSSKVDSRDESLVEDSFEGVECLSEEGLFNGCLAEGGIASTVVERVSEGDSLGNLLEGVGLGR